MKPTKEYNGRSRIRMFNVDCMELMKTGTWDLAIVDPPYGIGANKMTLGNGKRRVYRGSTDWDKEAPPPEYFDSLNMKSKNIIIWGANHYLDNIPFNISTPCWLFWDKNNGDSLFADGELAWASFKKPVRKVKIHWCGSAAKHETGQNKIHPTQKPVQLYKWLLTNYAKEGDTILDTHGGSLSIAIACWDLGFNLDVCELDKDYFDMAVKRFENHISQTQLF